MAVFKLGAFVTEIAGSVGGTTFKRFGSTQVMYNKSRGGSKNKLLANNKLAYLSWLSKQWRTLTISEKNSWEIETEGYTFPDKFGVPRVLSAKDFFIKCNGNLTVTGQFNADASSFDGVISIFNIDDFIVDMSTNTALFYIIDVTAENYFLYQLSVTATEPTSFVFNRQKIVAWTVESDDFGYDLYPVLIERYPNLKVGDWVTVYVQAMSGFGLRGPKLVSSRQVI